METLEEVAERLIFKTISGNYGITSSNEYDQVDGYFETYNEAYLTVKLKWQQERSYSEEEMRECYEFAIENVQLGRNGYEWVTFDEWFEQFKKK